MKILKLFTLLLVFSSFLNVQDANAQDSLFFLRLDPIFGDLDRMDWRATYSVASFQTGNLSSVSSLRRPGNQVSALPTPLILKRGNACYQIGCQPAQGCKSCQLLWYDRNNDGKIQPRYELRCYCKEGRAACRVRGQQIRCK